MGLLLLLLIIKIITVFRTAIIKHYKNVMIWFEGHLDARQLLIELIFVIS